MSHTKVLCFAAVVLVFIAACHAQPAAQPAPGAPVRIQHPRAAEGAAKSDLKGESSYGLGYAYPYGGYSSFYGGYPSYYGSSYGYGYPYAYSYGYPSYSYGAYGYYG